MTRLRELAAAIQPLKVEGSLDREVTGLAYDSRRVMPGMVFVALRGEHTDGHDYIESAIDRGAVAVICERHGSFSQRGTRLKVDDSRVALARASACFYQYPASKLRVIGVTGTNGKTTVAFMIKAVLEAHGLKCGLIGTVRYEVGDRVMPAQRTTPEALEVQQMMAQMVRSGCQVCVMEVSSHALDQKRVEGIGFDVAIFTNLTQDHLDYHETMGNYFAAKQKLFTDVAKGGKLGTEVINIDDAYGARLAGQGRAEVKLTYGMHDTAHIRAAKIELGTDVSRFVLELPDKSLACRLPLLGRHNIYNALAAVGACVALKVPAATIRSTLNRMPCVPGRLERLVLGQPFGVFVDYAHTDDALRNVLTTLREITSGRLLVAFGCGGCRDAGKRPKMGRVVAELADFAIITSDNPRKESAAAIAAQIEAGYREQRPDGYEIELDRSRAIARLLQQARPGDSVLLAGKGHETYQEFEDTVIPFDDRVHARETLEALGFSES